MNFKALADQLGIARSRLTFASEDELEDLLGVVSGMVTPLALMHDGKHEVQVLLNRDLHTLPEISAHPNINTATVLMSYGDLLKVLRAMRHEPMVIG
ncbi:YbaK/EbsC family protein [Lentilactobacillus kisonensis]|uniref:YbaK/EbsC family protein n=1 Tax=Lentilactobacillus kisonensis TaxID=481722 RepID=UPI000B2C44F4|nr:YbaK/EbsC family protein [Lentilactobacillus kisonensis]